MAEARQPLVFMLNGRQVATNTDPTAPLLSVLRQGLKQKGTRFGCGAEQCGACTVLVEGRPAFSCSVEAGSVAGRAVSTIEGLAQEPLLADLVAAFVAEQAGQCGYCLSGILMSSLALLKRNPAPERAAIVHALEPHLCRCGIYNRAIRAVQRAAATRQDAA